MGQYSINVVAVGGHGCQRDKKQGEFITDPCADVNCPDCKARAFVADLKASHNYVESATLTHWPGTEGQVIDNLLTGERTHNSF